MWGDKTQSSAPHINRGNCEGGGRAESIFSEALSFLQAYLTPVEEVGLDPSTTPWTLTWDIPKTEGQPCAWDPEGQCHAQCLTTLLLPTLPAVCLAAHLGGETERGPSLCLSFYLQCPAQHSAHDRC